MNKREYISSGVLGITVFVILLTTGCPDTPDPPDTCNLTIQNDGNGTTNPSGLVEVEKNEPLEISAIPNPNYNFDNWEVISGDGVSFGDANSAETTVTLASEDAAIQANFIPGGYSVNIDQPYINSSNETALSFTFADAEVGSTYNYSVDDINASTPAVSGTGTIATGTDQVTGIDVSGLDDGTVTVIAFLTASSGNPGVPASDTVIKDTVFPSFISVDDGGGDNSYMPGETITFTVDMGETGLTVTTDLSVLDSAFSSTQVLADGGDNTYSCTTAPLNSGTMAEGTDIVVTFSAIDAGNNSDTDTSLTLLLDGTPPGGSFVINDDNDFVISGSVTLSMTITGAAEMRFGNTISERNSATWENYSSGWAWSLSSASELKTVYGEFRDAVGNIFQANDTIIRVKKFLAGDGAADDHFGVSVAVSSDGSTVVVGAHYDDDNYSNTGSVYVYNGTDWGTETKLTASDGVADDWFGKCVSLSANGSVIAVSSLNAVYVYSGTGWGTETILTADDFETGDNFGYSSAISSDGSTVVAGSIGDDDKGLNSGSAYVYSGTNWETETKLIASDGAASDWFGWSVSVSSNGSIVVVGACDGDGIVENSGSVYVYSGTDWGTETELMASDGALDDEFGRHIAVSADGSTIVAGSPLDDDNGGDSGSVYIYRGTDWGTETKLTAGDGVSQDSFGGCVAVSSNGSIITAGARLDDDNGADSGSVYVYSNAGWGTEKKLTAIDGGATNSFGFSVSVSSNGSIILIGAYQDDDNGSFSGSAYLFPSW